MFGQRRTFLEHSFFFMAFMGLPIIGGIIIVLKATPYIYTYVLGSAVGMVLITKAKFPAFKRGEFMSFGTKDMTSMDRIIYWIGYGIVALTLGGGVFLYLS